MLFAGKSAMAGFFCGEAGDPYPNFEERRLVVAAIVPSTNHAIFIAWFVLGIVNIKFR